MLALRPFVCIPSRRISTTPVLAVPNTLLGSAENVHVPLSNSAADDHKTQHLDALFPPLRFPDDLARRLLTHGSHPSATNGHNARFAFIGRRVLDAYLLLFLNSSSAYNPRTDTATIVSRTLHAHLLGEHVSPPWKLAHALTWTPALSAARLTTFKPEQSPSLRSVGLYKVHGEAVQAIVGGIFHQFGASITHRVFYTRVLPHILLPGRPEGLPDVFHDDALRACERLGGPDSLLASPSHAEPLQ